MGLGGAISNLLSLGAKLLPAVTASAQAPSSSSSSPAESHLIEADLKSLMKMLDRIKATLFDAEERELRDRSVKLWLKELKGVAYDAEDVLGEYHYEVLRAQVEARDASAPNSRKRKQVQMPDGMVDQIKQIKGRFKDICKDRIALRLTEEDGPRRCNSELQIAPTSPFVVESNIFGREREKERLIDLLSSECHDDNVVSVVAIVGTGGLGKTTLAQLSYNDQKIRQRFGKFGWLCVSEDFNVERLTRELIESITGNTCDLTNLSALQNKISEEIRGQMVLIILDDVWNDKRSLWESFQAPFRSAALVKILVTTRNEPVARIMQTMPTFNLGYLSEEQCWLLFQHYAFGEVIQNVDSKLVEIGKKIMNQCGMLPLALKSIASLLRHEAKEESWREILESELWESGAGDEIFPPLQISYARLPTYLKPCFLYCSMFPKDYCYCVEELVQLWISQGYIESSGKKNTKEIGREYAKHLWQRSFFESKYWENEYDQAEFKLHDMVHELARFNSENRYYSIEAGKVPDFPNELYHLFVENDNELALLPGKLTALRTLIAQYSVNISSAFDFFEAHKLRALELNGIYCEFKVLSSLGNLKHLRYLSLQDLSLEVIPECICSLYSLQNLSIHECLNLKELPKSFGNLVSLEQLVIDTCDLRVLPVSLCQLKALTELILLNVDKLEELPNDMGSLTNLQTLKITGSNLRVLPVSLCQLKGLTKLILSRVDKLEELPNDMGSLTNLQTLEIPGSNLKVLPVSLCQLKGLTKLILSRVDKLEELPNDMGSLTNLQTLEITGSNLRVLPVSLCQLKGLTKLILSRVDKLEELPNDMGSLTNLQTLEITGSNLRVLPVSLCQLKGLIKLRLLKCTKLEELPNDMGSLTNLQTLEITGFERRLLPVSLCQLKALTELNIVGSIKLEEVPNDTGILTNLLTLVITGIPNSVSSRPPSLSKLKGSITLKVMFKCKKIGWLRECVDLDGTLCLWGLNHISSLIDSQCANLVSMHNLDCLKLCWGLNNPRFTEQNENEVLLKFKSYQSTFADEQNDFSLMDRLEPHPNLRLLNYSGIAFPNWIGNPTSCASLERTDEQNDFSLMDRLQPHPNLRELHIMYYGGIAFPNWIGNPILCASLERIVIENCINLTFLPFGSLCKLKYLKILRCCSLQFLRAESLPVKLEELEIYGCAELISMHGIRELKFLVELRIINCEKLQLLGMDELSLELTMRTNESSYQNSLMGLKSLTSLRSLQIADCPKLQVPAYEVFPVPSCKFNVSNCPGLKEWCLQQGITYKGR